jgi:hypothetical protein
MTDICESMIKLTDTDLKKIKNKESMCFIAALVEYTLNKCNIDIPEFLNSKDYVLDSIYDSCVYQSLLKIYQDENKAKIMIEALHDETIPEMKKRNLVCNSVYDAV